MKKCHTNSTILQLTCLSCVGITSPHLPVRNSLELAHYSDPRHGRSGNCVHNQGKQFGCSVNLVFWLGIAQPWPT